MVMEIWNNQDSVLCITRFQQHAKMPTSQTA